MEAGIVVKFRRRLHHAHLQRLFRPVPGFRIPQGTVPVQRICRKTDRRTDRNQKGAATEVPPASEKGQQNRRRAKDRGGGYASLQREKII